MIKCHLSKQNRPHLHYCCFFPLQHSSSAFFDAARLSWINIGKMSDGVWQKLPFQLSIPRQIWTAFLHFNISLLVFIVTTSTLQHRLRLMRSKLWAIHFPFPTCYSTSDRFYYAFAPFRQLRRVEVGKVCKKKTPVEEMNERILSIGSPRQFYLKPVPS